MISLIGVILAIATQPSFSLNGKVTDNQGKPIESAKVYVISAQVRPPSAADCPSNYKGVGALTASDTSGAFTLDELDSRLKYRVVVIADHFKAKEASASVDTKRPLFVKLLPQPKELNNDNSVTGHVFDNDGKPIAGALVTLQGEKYQGGHSYGGI